MAPGVAAAAAEPLPCRLPGGDLFDEAAMAAGAHDVVLLVDVNEARATVAPIRRRVRVHFWNAEVRSD